MKLFDSHCHFETLDRGKIAADLARAKSVGVERILVVGGSDALNHSAILAREISAADPELPRVAIALGYDRDQVGVSPLPSLDQFLVSSAAIGEIGLDYHYSPETREAQLKLFAAQLTMARDKNLPVVIHTREADADTVGLLSDIPSRGVIHCYTGSVEYAKKFLDLGFYISISGIVTFKAAENVREVARMIPDDRFLIETDSPFLAPVPMRGNPNEPAFVRHTCEFLAALRGKSAADFAALTFANASRMLALSNDDVI